MSVQIQVTEAELLLKIGRLQMHVEALQTLLDRCAQAMTPEQLEAAGIRATPPAPAPLPAGHEGVPVGGAISMNGQVIPPEAVSVGHGEDRDR